VEDAMRDRNIRQVGVVASAFTAALLLAACGSTPIASKVQARDPSTIATTETTATATTTATTSPPGVYNSTPNTTIIDPNTYDPSYDTISSLAADAIAVFIGTVQPFVQDPASGAMNAPFSVDKLLFGEIPRTYPDPEIHQGASGDVPVVVGHQYLVFWTVDSTSVGLDADTCVVGGMRGIFNYDAATQTLTRIATSASQIPTTLTLAQLTAQLPNPNVQIPERVPNPPVCSPSVIG
jgi:hypothetical protein